MSGASSASPVEYRDAAGRVWHVSEVARVNVVTPSIDGPSHFLIIRFEREGEERFARWIGGEDWRERGALQRMFAEAEPVGAQTIGRAQTPVAVEAAPVTTAPEPNDTATAGAPSDERTSLAERSPARWDYDPQQALLVTEPPIGDQWVHEIKLD